MRKTKRVMILSGLWPDFNGSGERIAELREGRWKVYSKNEKTWFALNSDGSIEGHGDNCGWKEVEKE